MKGIRRQRMKRFLKEETGSFSIWYVLLSLIGVLIVAGMFTIFNKSFLLNETQSIMDIAGVSALQANVNQEELRHNQLVVNPIETKRTYRSLINKGLSTYPDIHSYQIKELEVVEVNDTFGLGQATKKRQQVLLKSTILLKVTAMPMVDSFTFSQRMFYDAQSDRYFTVQYNGKSEDGETELIVRSVSRIVYR